MTTASHAFWSTAAPRSSRASCRGVGSREIRVNLFSVQAMRCDVSLDRRRHPALDRSPVLDVIADPAGGYVGRAFETEDHAVAADARPLEVRLLGGRAAGARDHHERCQLSHPPMPVPGAELPARIPAQDAEKLRA